MGMNNQTYHVVKGANEIVELRKQREWNRQTGTSTVRRFIGPSPLVEAKFNELANTSSVDELRESYDGYRGELLVRIFDDSGTSTGGNTEALNAVWELYAIDERKPIETHTDFDSISAERKRALEYAAANAAWVDGNGIEIDKPSTDAEKSLYGHYSHQVLDYIMSYLILRKTTVVSNRSTITASYTNMNRVVAKTAQTLTSEIGPPRALFGTLTDLPLMSGGTGAWEWLKKAPQIRQVGREKFQLIYEWHGAERWSVLYGGGWKPTYQSS